MRQFVLEQQLDSKGCAVVEGKKYHYLSSVLRTVPGDMVYVRLPDGKLVQMTVAQVDSGKKRIVLQLAGDLTDAEDTVKAKPIAQNNGVELWLFMFAAKPPKMDLVIRQAVECGVSYVVPVKGTFCQKSCVEAASKKDERWSRIITEAREQSGSPVNTKVLPLVSVEEMISLWKNGLKSIDCENGTACVNQIKETEQAEAFAETVQESVALVLYEQTKGTKALHEACKAAGKIKKAAVVTGAEGGISPEEVELMQKNGFIPVHFATNILRCETAALYGIAALQTVLMENGLWQFKE